LGIRPADAHIIFSDGFETGTTSWSLTGTWGRSSTIYYSGSYSLTDSPAGSYAVSTNHTATKATPFSLVGATSPTLSFWHRYAIESGWDYGYVEVSTNGTSWTSLASYTGTNNTWTQVTLSLAAYTGQANVYLRFRLYSDSIYAYDGWYIDDVVIDNGITAVNLTSPVTGNVWAGNTSKNVTWTYDGSLADAASFRLDYSTDGGATYPNNIASGLAIGTTSHAWTVPALDTSTARVRVQALDASSNVLATSASGNFTIDSTPPGAFTLVTPANAGCTGPTPFLDWNNSTGVSSYSLTVTPTTGSALTKTGLTISQYTLLTSEALSEAGNPHVWAVTALDTAGNTTSSGSWSFFVDNTPPDSFALSAPADGTYTRTSGLTLSWAASGDTGGCGLSKYRLYIDNVLCADNIPASATSIALSATSCTSLANGNHVWRVSASDGANNLTWCTAAPGGTGGWNFIVDNAGPTAPSLTAPAANAVISDPAPTFSWTASTDAGVGGVTYQLYLNGVATGSPTTDTSVTPGATLSDSGYSWYVRATDSLGNFTNSTTRTVTIDTTPPLAFSLLSPASGSCSTSPTPSLCWNATTDAVAGIYRYQLYVNSLLAGATTGTCTTPSSALSQGLHNWYVTAVDNAGNTRSSTDVRELRIDYTSPIGPALVSPSNGAQVTSPTPTLTWQTASDAGGIASYTVYVDGISRGTVTGDKLSWQPSNTLSFGSHSWQVVATDLCGLTGASATFSFAVADCITGQTEACPGTTEGICDPGTRTCGFTGEWSDCSGIIPAAEETCNDLDDDCDGVVDNGTNDCGGVCPLGQTLGSSCAGVNGCLEGTWECDGLNEVVCLCTQGDAGTDAGGAGSAGYAGESPFDAGVAGFGGGTSSGGTAGTGGDTPSGGRPSPDAGVDDAGVDDAGPDAGGFDTLSKGCGCRVAARAKSEAWLTVLLLGLAPFVRRRRLRQH
jgi:MYXO-CTERM domain-containing protein